MSLLAARGEDFRSAKLSQSLMVGEAKKEKFYLNTIPNLITSLLSDLSKKYVLGTMSHDIKMRARIEKVIRVLKSD